MDDQAKPHHKLCDARDLMPREISLEAFRAEKTLDWRGRTDQQSNTAVPEVHSRAVTSFSQCRSFDHLLIFLLQISEALDIWLIGGMNIGNLRVPIYAEIMFVSQHAPGSQFANSKRPPRYTFFETFRSSLGSLEMRAEAVLKVVELSGPRRQVYIPAEHAHPQGSFFVNLGVRRERICSLFVSFYGARNPRLCTSCIGTYTRTVTGAREHVLAPYSECVSFPGFSKGTCSNCLWHGYSDCSWRFFPGYQVSQSVHFLEDVALAGSESVEVLGQSGSKDLKNPPEVLSQATAPRILNMRKWFKSTPEHRQQVLRDACSGGGN